MPIPESSVTSPEPPERTKLPNGYRVQPACANCKHCHDFNDYESDHLFCLLMSGPVPEDRADDGAREEAWLQDHSLHVRPEAICDIYLSGEVR